MRLPLMKKRSSTLQMNLRPSSTTLKKDSITQMISKLKVNSQILQILCHSPSGMNSDNTMTKKMERMTNMCS